MLLGYSIESVQEKQAYVFKLSNEGGGKDILFAAENEEEFLEWWNRFVWLTETLAASEASWDGNGLAC